MRKVEDDFGIVLWSRVETGADGALVQVVYAPGRTWDEALRIAGRVIGEDDCVWLDIESNDWQELRDQIRRERHGKYPYWRIECGAAGEDDI